MSVDQMHFLSFKCVKWLFVPDGNKRARLTINRYYEIFEFQYVKVILINLF